MARYNPRLHALPIRERPASRLDNSGVGSLSLSELLAAIVGGARQLEVADQILVHYQTLSALYQASTIELEQFAGIGHATAARLKAGLEIGKRLIEESSDERPTLRSPQDVANLLMNDMALLEKEELRVVILNTKAHVLDIDTVVKGSVNAALVRPAEVFREPVRLLASSVIVAHNHPSGDPTPSPEDARMTETLVKAGEHLDIAVLDHLIFGRGRYVSLKERGLGF